MRLLTDEKLGNQFADMVGRMKGGAFSLEAVLGKIARGEGSLGSLVHDPSIIRSLQDVFLGVQEMGYVSNVIRNAEARGREVTTRADRASQIARLEAARARFLASVPRDDGGFGLAPSSAKDGGEARDSEEIEPNGSPDLPSKDDSQ